MQSSDKVDRYLDCYQESPPKPNRSVRNRIIAATLVTALTIGGGYEINRATGGLISHGLSALSHFVNPGESNLPTPTAITSPTEIATTTPLSTPFHQPQATIPSLTPIAPKTVPTPVASETAPSKLGDAGSVEMWGDATITLDQDGIPKICEIDGATFNVYEAAKEARELSLSQGGEPEVVVVIPRVVGSDTSLFSGLRNDDEFKPSPDRPLVVQAPETVTTQELAKRGIVISQSPNVQLSIRPETFVTGPLKTYTATSKYGLHIVLIPGPVVSALYLLPDQQKYAPLLPPIPTKEEVEAFRQELLDSNMSMIIETKQKIASTNNKKDVEVEQLSLLWFKYKMKVLQQQSDDEILRLLVDETRNIGGYGFNIGSLLQVADDIKGRLDSVIFIPVGSSGPELKSELVIFVDGDGFHYRTENHANAAQMRPFLEQTHPRPSDFGEKSADPNDPEAYTVRSGYHLPFALIHELEHDELMIKSIARGELPYLGKYDADEAAIAYITKAFERWQKSGFKDDSDYCFTFTFGGGKKFILTRNENLDENLQPKPVTFNPGKDKQGKEPWKQESARAKQYDPSLHI